MITNIRVIPKKRKVIVQVAETFYDFYGDVVTQWRDAKPIEIEEVLSFIDKRNQGKL